jgi:hypothetical protein
MDMREVHADRDLSAYLDAELTPAERTRVDAHLATCDRCSRRLGELRATASLVAALPSPRPARSLVPAVTERWTWLRPIRSLSMIASGAFLFVFLLTAVARTGTGLGGADAPAAAQPATSAFGAGGAPAATAAPRAASVAPAPAVQAPAPTTAFGTFAPTQERSSAGATAAPTALADAQKRQESTTSSPNVPQANVPQDAALRSTVAREGRPSPLLEPLLWLALAIFAAAGAIVAHVRLHRT